MAVRPGTNIVIRDTPPIRTAPTDTGVWFVVGLADKGSTTAPILIESMSDFVRLLGDRQSYSILYDAVETFFREGGAKVYVSRVVGPAAASAFVVLNDGSAAATLRVEALNAGAWGNSLNVQVTAGDAGGEFKLVITHDTLGTLETSPSLVDKTAAFAWAANSSYIKLVDQASVNDPAVVAAQSLASGADDRNNITDAHWETALGRFTADYGPGQVSYPGRTTDQAHIDLLEHAAAMNRVAIMDAADTTTKATLLAAVSAARTANARYGGLFAPWIKVPGLTPGTTRTVPPSPFVAGRIAAQDALTSANEPAAGEAGQAQFAIDITQPAWSDTDRVELNAAGVNVIRLLYGGVRIYGWRSLANPTTESQWLNFGNVRLVMEIANYANIIAEQFLFAQLDGQGKTISQFGGALTALLLPYWQEGALYGTSSDQAFVVDVGSSVNTPTSLANGELKAVLGIRPSPFAEMVTIEILKTPITMEV